jgi:hypothetical protein
MRVRGPLPGQEKAPGKQRQRDGGGRTGTTRRGSREAARGEEERGGLVLPRVWRALGQRRVYLEEGSEQSIPQRELQRADRKNGAGCRRIKGCSTGRTRAVWAGRGQRTE